MHRVDNATSADILPTPAPVGPNPDGFFVDQTIVENDWLNAIQEELCNFIEDTGFTLDKTKQDQLSGSLNARYMRLSYSGVMTGYKNLVIQNNAIVPISRVDIVADYIEVTSSSGEKRIVSNVNLTSDITVTGINGVDIAEQPGVWHHIWVISNGVNVASLLSGTIIPVMPSGYTYKGYVGSVFNKFNGDFINFIQKDNKVSSDNEQLSGNTIGTAIETMVFTEALPHTAKKATILFHLDDNSGAGVKAGYVSSNINWTSQYELNAYVPAASGVDKIIDMHIITNSTIYFRSIGASTNVWIGAGKQWEY